MVSFIYVSIFALILDKTVNVLFSLYTLDGVEISEPSQIKSLEKYVAVGYGQKFIKLAYNENGSTSLTPRRGGPKVKSTSSEPPYRKVRVIESLLCLQFSHLAWYCRNLPVKMLNILYFMCNNSKVKPA